MKYTKKMKLVDIDEPGLIEKNAVDCMMSDSNYASPRVLSALDGIMDAILKRNDLDDGAKWILYNQTLHRYLNFVKNQQNQTSKDEHKADSQIVNNHAFNQSFDLFKPSSSAFEISGIEPLRDSLDAISQPIVREFFENARNKIPIETSSTSEHDSPMDVSGNTRENLMPARGQRRNKAKPPNKRRRRVNSRFDHNRSPLKRRDPSKRQNDSIFKPMRAVKILIPRWTPSDAK